MRKETGFEDCECCNYRWSNGLTIIEGTRRQFALCDACHNADNIEEQLRELYPTAFEPLEPIGMTSGEHDCLMAQGYTAKEIAEMSADDITFCLYGN